MFDLKSVVQILDTELHKNTLNIKQTKRKLSLEMLFEISLLRNYCLFYFLPLV